MGLGIIGSDPASATTYQLDFPSIFVTGAIVTDGTLGSLSGADIQSWTFSQNVLVMGAGFGPASMSSSEPCTSYCSAPFSTLTITGSALTATSTGLFFDFSATDGSLVNFATNSNPGLSLQFCDTVAPCTNQNGASLNSFVVLDIWNVFDGSTSEGLNEESMGSVQIGQADISATPLPATLPLFVTGLGALGLLGWCRKRKNATALLA